jgi:hypothetical protein
MPRSSRRPLGRGASLARWSPRTAPSRTTVRRPGEAVRDEDDGDAPALGALSRAKEWRTRFGQRGGRLVEEWKPGILRQNARWRRVAAPGRVRRRHQGVDVEVEILRAQAGRARRAERRSFPSARSGVQADVSNAELGDDVDFLGTRRRRPYHAATLPAASRASRIIAPGSCRRGGRRRGSDQRRLAGAVLP